MPDQKDFETEEEYFKACREHRETMNTKTAEEILKSNLKNIYCIKPDDTYAQVLKSMEEYASPLKKRIEELEAALDGCRKIMHFMNCPDTVKVIDNILNPSTNGKQD